MSKRSLGLLITLAVVFCLWMDFVGLFLSVASTYFYFGWEGTPHLTLIIFAIALLCFSGPTWERLLFSRVHDSRLLLLLTTLLLANYLLVTFFRSSHFFAWATVTGTMLGGLTAVVALRETRHERSWFEPTLGIMAGYVLAVLGRVLNHGMAPLFVVSWTALLLLLLLAGLALFLRSRPDGGEREAPENTTPAPPLLLAQSHAVAAGLLVGLSVGLLFNLNVWSRGFALADMNAGVFLLTLGAAMAVSLGLLGLLGQNRFATVLLLVVSALFAGLGLKMVLDMPTTRASATLCFAFSAFGMTTFWGVFLRRLHLFLQQNDGRLPTLGLQIGFVLFLFVLLFFLLFSNPNGFWFALGLSLALLLLVELTSGDIPLVSRLAPRYSLAVVVLFVAPAILAMTSQAPTKSSLRSSLKAPKFSVMTANIRYGWTDDYRYEPRPMVGWLKKNPADLIGFQEFNRGHTSGSYMDLFSMYNSSFQGFWRYADANYGFGNALYSRFPIKSAALKKYDASDILRRSCLSSVVEIHGQPIQVMATHLSHLPHVNKIRQAQVKQLIRWVKKNKRPWILMGDMNAEPNHPEIQWLKQASHPVFAKRASSLFAKKTHPSAKPNIRIDYIFFSKHFKLHSMDVLNPGTFTDHRPVRAVLSLETKRAPKTRVTAPRP